MHDNVTLWKIEEMARVLGVSRSGYYHFCHRKISKRQQENDKLQEMIKTIFSSNRFTYGSPRIHAELKAQGIYDWLKLKEASGNLKAKAGYQNGHSHKIKDLEKFKLCIEKNAGLTLEEIIKKSDVKISFMTCSRSIKKLNITRKKRLTAIKNEMKTSDGSL